MSIKRGSSGNFGQEDVDVKNVPVAQTTADDGATVSEEMQVLLSEKLFTVHCQLSIVPLIPADVENYFQNAIELQYTGLHLPDNYQ